MDFDDSPEEAGYRASVRKWLAEAAPAFAPDSAKSPLESSRAWQAAKAAAGFAAITWPAEWGGRGGSEMEAVIFHQEEGAYSLPQNLFEFSLGINLPTLLTFADAATRERFAGPAMRGEEIWCQLLSEPSCGSDLAAVCTRAVQVDDGTGDWLINGQKVWTTFAHYADYGIALVRTNPSVPKHAGMTMFWIDMRAPGVEIRPINQMTGTSKFSEVFLEDVRVPDAQRLGPVGGGWKCSMTMLSFERMAVSAPRGPDWPEFMALAAATVTAEGCALDKGAIRDKLAEWYVQSEGLKHLRNRAVTTLSRGGTPGPEVSVGKLVASFQLQEMASAALDLLGEHGIIEPEDFTDDTFAYAWLDIPGSRIAGGTDEILRNIIAERILGLPADIRVDKDRPFNAMPR